MLPVDEKMINEVYKLLPAIINTVRELLDKPLTLTEKILYSHLASNGPVKGYQRGKDYVQFSPDRVAMQDATGQMALLQLINSGRKKVAVPTTVHCDHLIVADKSASSDLETALTSNKEVYDFLRCASARYGIGFWEPGAGIIHQVILENYAFPGGLMIGTDSHTPNAGGLGMIGIGVGGADAVDVMAGLPWELKMPRIIGVRLTGKLSGWTSPKDVILELTGILSAKGGTNSIIEYFGPGTETLSATGKGTICNMGAEVGATASIFPFDKKDSEYLKATGRESVAEKAIQLASFLCADAEVYAEPRKYYDRVIEIDLSKLEPYINGPFTPDAAWKISEFAAAVKEKGYPESMEAGLIGSCTNSSYEDLSRAASVVKSALEKGLEPKSGIIINPGSERVRRTAGRDGLLDIFKQAGAVIMANACGPCIGQWKRKNAHPEQPNSIVTSFNRNFAKRNDGNPNTYAFVASPEIVAAMSFAGSLCFNPLSDKLINGKGEKVGLDEPHGFELPENGYGSGDCGFTAPPADSSQVKINVQTDSQRLQMLKPFPAWDGKDMKSLALLIKVKGKCTTDHISMAGPWLRFRGHLDHISDNLLMGAVNFFNGKTNTVLDSTDHEYKPVSNYARILKGTGKGSVIVAEENYGEGSSREHAAMEPRFLNVKAILVKSFARIHETNLKKQGVLALTFTDKNDYGKIMEDDLISITGLTDFTPGKLLTVKLNHSDGNSEEFPVSHSYDGTQIEWFKAGSALNAMKK